MARKSLILVCVSVVLTQLVVVSFSAKTDEIDWTTVHDDLRKLGATFRKKCLAETGVTIDKLEGAEMGQFPDDRKLACYFKCVMEKGGVMKKDGTINYKVLAKLLPQAYKQIGIDMMDECRDIEGSDSCEKGMKFHQCMYNANPVAFFVI
ncbi:pheromone-binding protein-related protein 6 [Solenopsis invicta]